MLVLIHSFHSSCLFRFTAYTSLDNPLPPPRTSPHLLLVSPPNTTPLRGCIRLAWSFVTGLWNSFIEKQIPNQAIKSYVRGVATCTCKPDKPGLTSFSEALALFFIQFLSFRKMKVQERQKGPLGLPEKKLAGYAPVCTIQAKIGVNLFINPH